MENMFSAFSKMMESYNEKKRVPKNLDECRAIEPAASALNKWARLANFTSLGVAVLIFVIGIFVGTEAEEFSAFLPFLFIGWIVLAVGEFFAILIRGLASIVYNTGITANVALMNANQGEDAVAEEPPRPPVHIKQTSKEVSKLEDALYE